MTLVVAVECFGMIEIINIQFIRITENWILRYVMGGNWKADIKAGFAECFRVLRPFGTLVFKWNTEQIPFSEVIKLAPEQPLFGDKRVNTRWVVFCKGARASDRATD